ncbi:MAG: hypothetical protein NVS9B15_11030 [Acidobacteriaceae bacterium]
MRTLATFLWFTCALAAAQSLTLNQISEGTLKPGLNPAIRAIRFSPDGRYVAAVAADRVVVLTREPFRPAFILRTESPVSLQFTPDSGALSFLTKTAIETWDVQLQKRISMYPRPADCERAIVSPTARVVACSAPASLTLREISTGRLLASAPPTESASFSPDGRYLLSATFAYDLESKKAITVAPILRGLDGTHAAWVQDDKVAIVDGAHPGRSRIVHFPDGASLRSLPFPVDTQIKAVSAGDYVLLTRDGGAATDVYDIFAQRSVATVHRAIMDVHKHFAVTDTPAGELALYDLTDPSNRPRLVAIPKTRLGQLEAASISPDFNFIALSNSARSAVYNLATGQRVAELRAMNAPVWNQNVVTAEFLSPRHSLGSITVSGARSGAESLPLAEHDTVAAAGSFHLITHRASSKAMVLEARAPSSSKALWSRAIAPRAAQIYSDPDCDRIAIQSAQDQAFELVEGLSGRTVGSITPHQIPPQSKISLLGDMFLISSDAAEDTRIIDKDGQQTARFTAAYGAHSNVANVIALIRQKSVLDLVDPSTGQVISTKSVPEAIRYVAFSPDGKLLFVLTDNQHYREFAVGARPDAVMADNLARSKHKP